MLGSCRNDWRLSDIIKTGRTIWFAQCVITADAEISARANGSQGTRRCAAR